MTSIFDLKTSVDELKESNNGMADMKYQQVTSTRGPLSGNDFPSSQIQMDWEMGPDRWWTPSRSYMRIRCKLTKAGGAQLTMADNIAPNMGLAANLFQKLEFKINNNTVATIAENVPLIDALYNRQSKSKSWLEGTGASFNWWTADQNTRQSQVSEDGTLLSAGGTSADVTTNRLGLGFDAAGGIDADKNASAKYTAASGIVEFKAGNDPGAPALPDLTVAFPLGSYIRYVSGAGANTLNIDMEVLQHVDATNIRVRTDGSSDVDADGRFDFVRVEKDGGEDSRRIDGFEIIWQPPLSIFGYGGALPVGRYTLLLTPQPVNSYQRFAVESTGVDKVPGTDFDFSVENMFMYVNTCQGPSVTDQDYVIDLETIESQETQFSGSNFQSEQFTVSPTTYQLTAAFQDSRIGINTLYSASKFKMGLDGADLKLARFHIQYAGKTIPSPDYDGVYKTGGSFVDFTGQMYAETMINTGGVYSEGSSESLEDWHKRGPYYSFMWPKSAGDMSTRAIVYFQFDASAGLVNGDQRLVLFAHSRKAVVISIRNGMVQNVVTQDV